PLAGRKQLQFIFLADCACDQSPGHDGSESLHREHTINRKPCDGLRVARRYLIRFADQLLLQLLQSCATNRAHRNDQRFLKKRSPYEFLYFHSSDFKDLASYQVTFCEHGNPMLNRQQSANIEVLARLRFDPFVGSNHQQHHINPANASQHVSYKTFMARNIHKPEPELLTAWIRKFEMCKSQINRDPPALLFRQPIGINPGQSLDERGLPVINVPSGTDDDGLHSTQYRKLFHFRVRRERRVRAFQVLGAMLYACMTRVGL